MKPMLEREPHIVPRANPRIHRLSSVIAQLFVLSTLTIISGCETKHPSIPVDASVADLTPLTVAETSGTWAGAWKYENNNLLQYIDVYIDTRDGEYVGSLHIGIVPNRSTYRAFGFQANDNKIKFSYQLVGTANSGTDSLIEAAFDLATDLSTEHPVLQAVLELNADGTAKVYDYHPEGTGWVELKDFRLQHTPNN